MKQLVTYAAVAALLVLPLGAPAQQQSDPVQQTQPQQQPPPPQQPTAPPPSAERPAGRAGAPNGATIASDSLVGAPVRDQQGKEIGQVGKLLIDPNEGKISSVVIKRGGGLLTGGGQEMAVPWNAVRVQRGQDQKLVVTMQQDVLEQAPAASPGSREERQKPDRQ